MPRHFSQQFYQEVTRSYRGGSVLGIAGLAVLLLMLVLLFIFFL